MKKILLSALLISIFASCKKLNDVLPASDPKDNTENIKPANPDDGKLLASIKVTPVMYNPQTQSIKVSTEDKKLNLLYTEKVQLLIDAERFTWYVLFKEDFSDNQFAGFDFNMMQKWGTETHNWKPDNVNQMDFTKTDTTIAGVKVVNLRFQRVFKFYKEYSSSTEATDKMNALVGKQEKIKFQTRYEPDTDESRYNVTSVSAVYVK
jgi:hypothetical protein